MKQFESGATSSKQELRYDLAQETFLFTLLAERLTYGADLHGERNYLKAVDDENFNIDRYNHALSHASRYRAARRDGDWQKAREELSALICNFAILADLDRGRIESAAKAASIRNGKTL